MGPGVNVYKLFLLQGELGKTNYIVSLWQAFKVSLIFVVKPGACTIKHYGFIMHGERPGYIES